MKRILIGAVLGLFISLSACAQNKKVEKTHVIGYYNVENLFDVYDDPVKNDAEFLPEGKNKWTQPKYEAKLGNIARVISEMAKTNGKFHTILGVSEIENRLVLEDLVAQPAIAKANYQIIHYESPDRRGIDVALLYRPDQFRFVESESIPFDFESEEIEFDMDKERQPEFKTRDVLMVRGYIGEEHFAFYVAHLPSRYGGKGGDLRSRGAEIIYEHAVKMMKKYPEIKISVFGDMNDNPTDLSIAKYLRGREKPEQVGEYDFFCPFTSMLKKGYGSLAYRGEWNIYDIGLVNKNLLDAPNGGYKIQKIGRKKNYGVVFKKPFMIQQEGYYKGYPFRAFSSGVFQNGYSDHFPTYIVIGK